MTKLQVLDLFSGIGGFSLGLERTGGFETKAFCEIDPFCRRVLEKHWPSVPCFEDVTTLRGESVGEIDVICGGFPCQDISSSGLKVGLGGKRSGLWSEFARLVGELRPRFVVVENVTDITSRGLGEVLGSLASLRYDAEWHSIPASFVGLPQARNRLWIVAHTDGGGCEERAERDRAGPIVVIRADDDRLALAKRRAREAALGICRVADGLPGGVDRLRALGNAVVPQIPELIGNAILESLEAA
jgi:DNA (cytosine-5)-methyltransferase 1